MQDRPTAAELLEAVIELLEETLMPATTGGVRHQARVAANLCRIVGRELAQGAELERRAIALIAGLLDRPAPSAAPGAALALTRELSERLLASDDELAQHAWPVLLELVRGKLAVAKPGYDQHDYAAELDEARAWSR